MLYDRMYLPVGRHSKGRRLFFSMKQTEPTKLDRQDREQRMRAKIKKAAFALMADRGIDQVSMREIAEKVKVTKPVLYYYFKNKEDLCRSIVAEHEQGFSKLLEDSFNRGDELESVLNRLLGAHLEFFRKTPVNSKFVVQMLAYTLNKKFPKEERKLSPEKVLGNFLSGKENLHRLPAGATRDISLLFSALFTKIMLNAYVEAYIQPEKDSPYTEETARRLTKIILLGVKQYYELYEK